MTTRAFRRITSTALAVAALATFSGCASMVSDADLNAQGRAPFEKMRAEVPLVRDRPTIEFVSCVADAIVTQLDGEAAQYEWELAIFDQQP